MARLGAIVSTVIEAPDATGVTAHVGAWAGVGCTEQLYVTVLLNPPLVLTVTVPVADCPAFTVAGESADALREKSGGTFELNVAVIVWSTLDVRVHAPVPEQPAPFQPAKLDPVAAMAVRVTGAPTGKVATQLIVAVFGTSQSIPGGLLVTVPSPVPSITAITWGSLKKVAVTCLSELRSRTQGPVPVHAPLHPVKWAPTGAAAIRVTWLPLANVAEQGVLFMSQLIAAGLLVTVPTPVMLLTCTPTLKGPDDMPPVTVC